MKELNKNTTFIYLNDKNEGFVLGERMSIVPQEYVNDYTSDGRSLKKSTLNDYDSYVINIDESKLINSSPVYAKLSEDGLLLIETP